MTAKTYELRVSLQDMSGQIWRRLRVPGDTDLAKLHEILQDVMGWEGYHLYAFEVGGEDYGDPDPDFSDGMRDARRVLLQDVLRSKGDRMKYIYDFGDDWVHLITVRSILPQASAFPVCLSGGGACPPEDCGGTFGYWRLLAALDNPEHPDHEEARDWVGDDFDPDAFEPEMVNWLLRGRGSSDDDDESIAAIISSFLHDQLLWVSTATYRKYQRCMDTLQTALNSYGYDYSSVDYDSVQEQGKTFCQVAELAPLLRYMKEFFGYFLPRKAYATVSEIEGCRATLRRFFEWLADEDIIDPDAAQAYRRDIARDAAKGIEAARVRWYEFAPLEVPPADEVDELIEDHLTVSRVEPGTLWLEDTLGGGDPIVVKAPRAFTDLCTAGMDLAVEVQRSGEQWYLVDVFNAYPE